MRPASPRRARSRFPQVAQLRDPLTLRERASLEAAAAKSGCRARPSFGGETASRKSGVALPWRSKPSTTMATPSSQRGPPTVAPGWTSREHVVTTAERSRTSVACRATPSRIARSRRSRRRCRARHPQSRRRGQARSRRRRLARSRPPFRQPCERPCALRCSK